MAENRFYCTQQTESFIEDSFQPIRVVYCAKNWRKWVVAYQKPFNFCKKRQCSLSMVSRKTSKNSKMVKSLNESRYIFFCNDKKAQNLSRTLWRHESLSFPWPHSSFRDQKRIFQCWCITLTCLLVFQKGKYIVMNYLNILVEQILASMWKFLGFFLLLLFVKFWTQIFIKKGICL